MKKITLLISSILIAAAASAQIKLYRGEYPSIFTDPIADETGWDFYLEKDGAGKAEYAYTENIDGTRSYNGMFSYVFLSPLSTSRTTYHGNLSGRFADNRQDGVWVLSFPYPDETGQKIGDAELRVTFTDGMLNGPVTFTVTGTLFDQSPSWLIKEQFAMENGRPQGAYSYESTNFSVKGEFTDGHPSGMWVRIVNADEEKHFSLFGQRGQLLQQYVIDPRTGDKTPETFDLYFAAPQLFEGIVMRDSGGVAAKKQAESSSDKVFDAVEQPAEFPGGLGKFYDFVSEHIKYPPSANENGIQGRVMVQFVVEPDGSITSPSILKGVDRDLDREALRVVSMSPKWHPGRNNGIAVRTHFRVPIVFRLKN